jgi:antirestriction protein ArdC
MGFCSTTSEAKMMSQAEIRERVTAEIVSALREGTIPWRKPWSNLQNTGLPSSILSKEPYGGCNFWTLQLSAIRRGFTSKWWGTWNAWRSLGFTISKRPDDVPPGQWGTRCVFFRPIIKSKKNGDGEDQVERFFVLKEFVLFSAHQIVGPGIEEYLPRPRPGGGFVDYGPAEEVIAATEADIRVGSRAVYHVTEDFIELPPKTAFHHAHDYYGTAFHELVHYTGHESRLNRLDKFARFGNEAYALEELCAELGSAYLSAHACIPQSDDLSNTASYLNSWLRVLGRDASAIFTVSSAASRAVDYILRSSRSLENTETADQPEEAVA